MGRGTVWLQWVHGVVVQRFLRLPLLLRFPTLAQRCALVHAADEAENQVDRSGKPFDPNRSNRRHLQFG
jgi:hypothetical protein